MLHVCIACGLLTKNPSFCCRRCAGVYNGKAFPKRKATGKCKGCKKQMPKGRTYCRSCHDAAVSHRQSSSTIEEYTTKTAVIGKHPSWKSAYIRMHARSVNRHRLHSCQVCGYSKHIEFCHIKAISSFPLTATLGEVNGYSNVAVLCRNCHWEFDHGLLVLSGPVSPVSSKHVQGNRKDAGSNPAGASIQ